MVDRGRRREGPVRLVSAHFRRQCFQPRVEFLRGYDRLTADVLDCDVAALDEPLDGTNRDAD